MVNDSNQVRIANEHGSIDIFIEKKRKIKNLILSYNAQKEAFLLKIPFYVSYKTAKEFILKKQSWIFKHHQLKKESQGVKEGYKNHILYLGKLYEVQVKEGIKDDQIIDSQLIFKPSRKDLIKRLELWYKKMALKLFQERLDECLKHYEGIIGKKVEVDLKVRKMKKRLGSMVSPRHLMVLNEKLVQLPVNLIDAVIYHELAHINHPHHQRSFYQELLVLCPHYKDSYQKIRRFLFWNSKDF